MGVVGEKTFLELCGVSCIELDLIPSDKKSCCVSRSFSKPIEKIYDLEERIKNAQEDYTPWMKIEWEMLRTNYKKAIENRIGVKI